LSLKTSYDLMACNFIWEHTRKSEKRIDKVKKRSQIFGHEPIITFPWRNSLFANVKP
jgi:hypothetical protein